MTESEILRVTLSYQSLGSGVQQNVFVFQFQGGDEDDSVVLDALEEWFTDVWHPAWADLGADTSEMVSFTADVISVLGTVVRTIGGAALGLMGGQPIDVTQPAVSGYFLAYTGLPKQRGSKYIPGVAENQTASGLLTPEAVGDLAVLLAIYIADLPIGVASILRPGIWSRVLATFQKFIGSGLLEVRAAYQRRRKTGVGI